MYHAVDLWLEWIKDEQKFVESTSDRENVNKLFEKAVQDYLCKLLFFFWVDAFDLKDKLKRCFK